MNEQNHTHITEILLLGFQCQSYWRFLLFVMLFIVYCVTITGNLLIITLVAFSKTLQSPMYVFLAQLSFSDILMTTDIVPNALAGVLSDGTVMSFSGCIAQWYVFGCSEVSECLILTVMAYDRYLAICKPLQYPSIMNLSLLVKLSILCWALGFFVTQVTMFNIFILDFCGPRIIDHFFCDLDPILHLSCSDSSKVKLVVFFICTIVVVLPLALTGTSYGCIVNSIIRMSSNVHRSKAFSTCSSHITVVCIYYGTLIVIYMVPSEGLSLSISKSIPVLYTVITPMINPIIYSLRNKEVKGALNIFTSRKFR